MAGEKGHQSATMKEKNKLGGETKGGVFGGERKSNNQEKAITLRRPSGRNTAWGPKNGKGETQDGLKFQTLGGEGLFAKHQGDNFDRNLSRKKRGCLFILGVVKSELLVRKKEWRGGERPLRLNGGFGGLRT